jgi:two-component system, OmpR family, response regulator
MAGMQGQASPRWRILLVDDCADDAELTMIELRGAGLEVECRCVDREDALIEALAGFAPQLVLSDLNMPGFSGRRAFDIVRERAPSTRFVFLSGSLDGHKDLPAADGVVLKDHLHALPALVRGLLGP